MAELRNLVNELPITNDLRLYASTATEDGYILAQTVLDNANITTHDVDASTLGGAYYLPDASKRNSHIILVNATGIGIGECLIEQEQSRYVIYNNSNSSLSVSFDAGMTVYGALGGVIPEYGRAELVYLTANTAIITGLYYA